MSNEDDWEKEYNEEKEKEKKEKKDKKKKKKKKTEEKKDEEDKKVEPEKKKEEDKKVEPEKKKEVKEKEKEKVKVKEKVKEKKEDEKEKKKGLNTEKDYLDFAQENAKKIKEAKPLPIFTLAYLKNIIELLGPSLDSNQINQILNISNKIFNQKLNEGEKKKVSTKVNIKVGKINERIDRTGDYDEIEEEEEEEEEKELDDVDQYI